MRNPLLILASAAVLLSLPTVASAQSGTATGAVTGGVAGAVVGGPVGAAVGAGVGATAGAAADASKKPDTVVVQPGATGSVNERTTTCVNGASSSTCTETNVRR